MHHTVASFLVDTLIANGIDQLYCLPGVQNDNFFDALYDRKNELIPIQTRHEQGAAYMATGAALATGKPQAFCVVPGPGFLNTAGALCTAYAANAPVCALIGQIESDAIGKQYGVLHEIPDQFAILEQLTKKSVQIKDGSHAVERTLDIFRALVSSKHQPVGIEIPVNVWNKPLNAVPNRLSVKPETPPLASEDDIDHAVQLIASSQRPLIVVGSGALNHSQEITQLTNILSAGVVAFRNGQGTVSADNPLSVGMPVAHELWKSTDLVIGLGSRMSMQLLDWGIDDDLKIIQIDINKDEIGRIVEPTVGIHGDLGNVLPKLLAELEPKTLDRHDWLQTIRDCKKRYSFVYAERLKPQLAFLNAIRAELPRDGIFVEEVTQNGYVARFLFPVYSPRTYISSGYQGTLGFGLATALGAAHARRDVPVVSISGDGGALFTIGELATAVHHNIPINCIIFNDNAFGNVKRIQKEYFCGRILASDLTSPDFVKLAESFGAQGLRATTPDELQLQLRTAFKHNGPTVIEVPVGEFPSPWDFVLMPRVRG